MNRIYYKEPVFRPPSEARSLLIQATEGCTHKCTFCISNFGKKYKIRDVNAIKKDLDVAREIYGPHIHRVFFLDGNALSIPFEELLEITRYAREVFPELERAGVYACGEDILNKTSEQLEELAEAGLKIVYVGLESGDDEILREINKQITSSQLIKAAKKVMDAGITFSGTIILGIAGQNKKKSRDHALNTARLINEICPDYPMTWYIGALTLMIPPHTIVKKWVEQGKFKPMSSIEILKELKLMISHVDDGVHDCVFRSNHASNYLVLKGTLARDKNKLLSHISDAITRPEEFLRPEYFRGL
ncbi:MAG: radical SAM protein [Promethearchaeota archaeon]